MKEIDTSAENYNISLSEETKTDYKDSFNLFDTNHDGTINSQKIREIMQKLGKNPTEQQLIQIIENVAKPGSDKIRFDDFTDFMEKKNKENDTEIEIINTFQIFAAENNGLIPNEELFHIIRTFGETLTDKEIEEIISEADVDGDGYINYEEFVRMMTTK